MNYSFFFDALFVDAFLFLTPPRTITPWPCLSNELVAKSDRFVGSLQKMPREHVPLRTSLTYSIKVEPSSCLRLMICFCFPTRFVLQPVCAFRRSKIGFGVLPLVTEYDENDLHEFVSYLHSEKENVFDNCFFLSSIQ